MSSLQVPSSGRGSYRWDDEVLPGVKWGKSGWVPSPAYWAMLADGADREVDAYISPGKTPLVEDVAFCLLGGYGVRMEVNRAAWERLRLEGVFENTLIQPAAIEALLREPMNVNGRLVRYRFPRQRAHRLSFAFRYLENGSPPTNDVQAFRRSLMHLPGIGPKTASWIARNWLGSDDVAILDVHVLRAGCLMGLFPSDYRLPRDYEALEQRASYSSRLLSEFQHRF